MNSTSNEVKVPSLGAKSVALVLLREFGDAISGKTVLQKLAYFLAAKTGADLEFTPYFYGPFSRSLEEDVDDLVLSGLAKQHTTVVGTSTAGSAISRTSFELTKSGEEEADAIALRNPSLTKAAHELREQLKGKIRPKPLSLAAKVHLILATKGLPMTGAEISAKSEELGWKLESHDVGSAAEILQKMGFLAA